jgi:UDP-N-acetyl-D-glucosamine dehydrogenase
MTYKKDVDDLRESASINLLKLLLKDNYKNIQFSDPYIKGSISIKNFKFNKKSIKLSSNNIKKFDIVVLMTDHDYFNYKMLYKNSKIIIDCRGRYSVDHKVYRA